LHQWQIWRARLARARPMKRVGGPRGVSIAETSRAVKPGNRPCLPLPTNPNPDQPRRSHQRRIRSREGLVTGATAGEHRMNGFQVLRLWRRRFRQHCACKATHCGARSINHPPGWRGEFPTERGVLRANLETFAKWRSALGRDFQQRTVLQIFGKSFVTFAENFACTNGGLRQPGVDHRQSRNTCALAHEAGMSGTPIELSTGASSSNPRLNYERDHYDPGRGTVACGISRAGGFDR